MVKIILSILLGYISGSIPFAIIVAYLAKRIDIRKVGTGNPGAANVWREVGKGWGLLVWACDLGKGVLPMFFADRILNLHPFFVALTGIAAVAGHCWSVFLRFRGGKGVATGGAVFFYLTPKIFPLAVLAYFIVQRRPRSPLYVTTIFIVVYAIIVLVYLPQWKWLVPALLIFLLVGVLANRDAIKEMIERSRRKK